MNIDIESKNRYITGRNYFFYYKMKRHYGDTIRESKKKPGFGQGKNT